MYLCLHLLFGRGDFLSPAGCDVVHALALAPVAAAGGDEAGAWPVGLDGPPAEARDGGYSPLDPPLAIAAPLKLVPAAAPAAPEVGVIFVAKKWRLRSFFRRSSGCLLLLLGHHRRRGARRSAAEEKILWLLVQWRRCRGGRMLAAWEGEGVVESRGRTLQQPDGGCGH